MKQKGDRVRKGVNEGPEPYLLQSLLRQGPLLFIENRHQPPAMDGEERRCWEDQLEVRALAEPALDVIEASGPPRKQGLPTSPKFRPVFVGDVVRAIPRINAKPQMDHGLCRNQGALGR